MRRILSVLLENESGALSRVIGLFSQRGYNIESLTVAPTDDPTLSRMTIQTVGDEKVLEQIEKQLHKLVDVLRVSELGQGAHVEREIMLVKIQASGYGRDEVKRNTEIFRGQIIDVTPSLYTVQLAGTSGKLDAFLASIRDVAKIVEVARSGVVGLSLLMCGGLDAMQTDYYSLYERYFAPRGIAMLTIDMPSVGFSSKWKLTQDSSLLHQHVLKALPNVPWVDHTRVAAFGFRFGANVAVRLAYLESPRLKAVACLGPVVHTLLSDFKCQQQVPEMYLDVLASRLGMHDASDEALRVELNRYSLKVQGLLGRRCPTPMLSGYWKNDPFSPEEDSRLITSSSADGKLLEIPFNPVYRNFDKGLQEITDWIEKRLC